MLEENCRKEVHELHRFFQEWYSAELPNSAEVFDRLAQVIGADFEIISPTGLRCEREQLLETLHAAHGSDPEARIWIEHARARDLGTDMCLVTYEEWQGHGDAAKGRLSSALFKTKPDLPNGVEWQHVHECWLPIEAE